MALRHPGSHTIERLLRLLPLRRQRFRDRVLAGMLLVALLPLAGFAALVVADLGSLSQGTADEAYRTLLETQEKAQQQYLDNQANLVALRLGTVVEQLDTLRARAFAALPLAGAQAQGRPGSAVPPPALDWSPAGSSMVAQSPTQGRTPSTVIAGPPSHGVPGVAPDATQVEAAGILSSPDLEQAMETLRTQNAAIRGVWVADPGSQVVRTVPAVDVGAAVRAGQLDTRAPLNRSGGAAFSLLARRISDAGVEPQTWDADTGLSPTSSAQASFSSTYVTGQQDEVGVTAYERVGGGTGEVVGLDLDVHQLLGDEVAVSRSDQKGAYSMLVGSDGRVLGGGDQVRSDFGLGSHWVGATLPAQAAPMRGGLAQVLDTGVRQTVRADLRGSARELFTSPLRPEHWVLVSTVPAHGLLPDQAALRRGVDAGVRHILRDGLPLLLLLVGLAFLLATLIARRLVTPVRALTVAAERLGRGNIDEPVPPQGVDEVGRLAESLERMRREVSAGRDAILGAARELEGRVSERTAELRARNDELVALNTLAGSLTRSLDPTTLLAGALEALSAFLPVEEARGYLMTAEGLRAAAGWEPASPVSLHDDRLAAAASTAIETRDLVVRQRRDGNIVGLPLASSDGPHGAIALLVAPGRRLDERGRSLLRAVADQVALALRTAALSAEGRELAVLEERTRLAREIHDTMAQQLTAMILQLESAEAFVPRDQARARRLVVEARDLARQALQEARRSVWDLRPAPLDETGLNGAIAAEAERLRRRTGLDIRLRSEVDQRGLGLTPEAEVAVFRIVQEALSNAVHHSGGEHIGIGLRRRGAELRIEVRDDGRGFDDAEAAEPGCFGLVGMRERARLIGATLRVDSRPGAGTRVEIGVPWPATAPEPVSVGAAP